MSEFAPSLSHDAGSTATELVAADEDAGRRLDAVLARLSGISRSRIKALIEAGQVTVDAVVTLDASRKIFPGERFEVNIPPPEPAEPQGEKIPLVVVYEDEHLIVIDKPAGLVVHPGAGNWTGTLVNALIAHCGASLSGIGGVARPGIVHRLDKGTTGLMVVAKNDAAHAGLAAQFADHGVSGDLEREYTAFTWGVPDRSRGFVDAALARSTADRQKIAVSRSETARRAVTHYEVRERFPDAGEAIAAEVACVLETGRTHQIRVHMTHIGHPLIGDPDYGTGFKTRANRLLPEAAAAVAALGRPALHAGVLGFTHPASGEPLRFEAVLPADLERLSDALGRWS